MYGKGTGVVYLVLILDSKWRAYSLLTCLVSLTEFPEKVILWKVSALTNNKADHGTWEENRRQETEFSSNDLTARHR